MNTDQIKKEADELVDSMNCYIDWVYIKEKLEFSDEKKKELSIIIEKAKQAGREEERKENIDTAFEVAEATQEVIYEGKLKQAIQKRTEEIWEAIREDGRYHWKGTMQELIKFRSNL
jgi:hypothetical protein